MIPSGLGFLPSNQKERTGQAGNPRAFRALLCFCSAFMGLKGTTSTAWEVATSCGSFFGWLDEVHRTLTRKDMALLWKEKGLGVCFCPFFHMILKWC